MCYCLCRRFCLPSLTWDGLIIGDFSIWPLREQVDPSFFFLSSLVLGAFFRWWSMRSWFVRVEREVGRLIDAVRIEVYWRDCSLWFFSFCGLHWRVNTIVKYHLPRWTGETWNFIDENWSWTIFTFFKTLSMVLHAILPSRMPKTNDIVAAFDKTYLSIAHKIFITRKSYHPPEKVKFALPKRLFLHL